MTGDDTIEEFRDNVSRVLPQGKVDKAIAIMLEMLYVKNVSEI
jgi:hypothetical protein